VVQDPIPSPSLLPEDHLPTPHSQSILSVHSDDDDAPSNGEGVFGMMREAMLGFQETVKRGKDATKAGQKATYATRIGQIPAASASQKHLATDAKAFAESLQEGNQLTNWFKPLSAAVDSESDLLQSALINRSSSALDLYAHMREEEEEDDDDEISIVAAPTLLHPELPSNSASPLLQASPSLSLAPSPAPSHSPSPVPS
jgi:hypothetical protein